jgi:hypothetical protein
VSIVFRNKFGNPLETRTVRIAGKGSADLLISLGAGFFEKASAEIGSSVPVSARLEVRGGRDPWSIEAQTAPTATKYILPHVEWNGIFTTRLLMLNTSSTATPDVRFWLHPSTKQDVPRVVQIMNPKSAASSTVESLFGSGLLGLGQEPGEGWLEVEVPGSQVVIVALSVDPNSGAASASALLPDGTSSWSLPFFVENSGYWTGLALANPSDAACSFTLTAYDRSGAVLGTFVGNLDPRQNRTALVYQWIKELANDSTGYILITSTAPVAPLAYFGTADGASLAAIPFTPISP